MVKLGEQPTIEENDDTNDLFHTTTNEEVESVSHAPYVSDKSSNAHKPTLLTNKVYIPFYKRYQTVLPEDEQLDFQPYEEIDKREEDIAMQYVYGDDPPDFGEYDRIRMKQVRQHAVLQHQLYKAKMEKRKQREGPTGGFERGSSPDIAQQTVSAILASRNNKNKLPSDIDGGKLLESEEKMVANILACWTKQRKLDHRKRIISENKAKGLDLTKSMWGVLQTQKMRRKIALMYKADFKEKCRKRFRKIISSVLACNRFIFIMAEVSGYTTRIVKRIREHLATEEENIRRNTVVDGRFVFNPQKYKATQDTHLSADVMYTLTKPWYNRSKQEIQKAIKGLQVLQCFSNLPANTQRLLATVGWIISVPEEKVIIRQGQLAQDYYILLSGKVSQTEFIGDPFGEHHPIFKYVKTYSRDSIFGEEAILKPDCIREYSVTSCTKCDIMTINVHHYYCCTMEPSDKRSLASDHIKFISINCQFLAKFPKHQLVEDAEHNIYLVYFRPGYVIEKSMADAEWVYVLRWGHCRAILEIPPGQKVQDAFNAQHIEFDTEAREPGILMEDRMTEPAKGVKDIMESKRTSDIVNKLVDKEVERLRAETLDSDWNVDAEIAEIREKRQAAERLLRPKRKREEREREKALRMELKNKPVAHYTGRTTLPPTMPTRQSISPSGRSVARRKTLSIRLPSVIATNFPTKISAEDDDIRKKLEDLNRKETLPGAGGVVVEKWIYQNEKDNDVGSERDDRRKSVLYRSKKMSIAVVDGNYEIEHTVPAIGTTSISPKKSFDAEKIIRRKLASLPEDPDNEEGNDDGNDKKHSLKSESSRGSVYAQPQPVPVYKGALHSKWKLKKSFQRGEQIGFEWIDLKDGKFREPEEDSTLVSDGCELVLIRKDFIDKHMGLRSRDFSAILNH